MDKASYRTLLRDNVVTITGGEPGASAAIIVGVHGDETCGHEALKEIWGKLDITHGKVTFLIGNPKAIERGVRMIDTNLNRMFKPDAELTDEEKSSYEYGRSREMMAYLDKADILLDIHSFRAGQDFSFVIAEPSVNDIAQAFPFPMISRGWDKVEPGSTEYYLNKQGKRGLCIECGLNGSKEALERAKQAIFIFLTKTGNIEAMEMPPETPKETNEVKYTYITKAGFVPVKDFANFESISQGDIIGHDEGEQIVARQDGFILFCQARNMPGVEAFLVGNKL